MQGKDPQESNNRSPTNVKKDYGRVQVKTIFPNLGGLQKYFKFIILFLANVL